ncbi:MAG: ABC transporter ATP-binding protein [Candidatus Omnitrophota bacterium]|jgi:putative ABC transport system ATP-binding protein
MSLIKLVDIRKTYMQGKDVKTEALRGINVEFDEGDFAVISGPSGSGKTTMLNLMGGLDSPTGGHVYLKDKNIGKLKEDKLARIRLMNFGFIFQAYNLIPVLTAEENIEYIMMLQGISAKKRRDKVLEIAKHLGIDDLLKKRPNQMSGGQQQRVAVARAVVSGPKVVFADEPTANLDSENSLKLLDLMKRLNEETKTTFIFSTHDPAVREKANRKIMLKDGKIV